MEYEISGVISAGTKAHHYCCTIGTTKVVPFQSKRRYQLVGAGKKK
jgi:hypothetical protein